MTLHKFFSLSVLLSVFILSACASGSGSGSSPVVNSMDPQLKTSAINRTMESALAQAEASGDKQEVLALLQQIQTRNPKDPIVATRYARALRDDEQINAAVRALDPFTKGADANIEAVTEMAMTQLTLGDFNAAEKYAKQSIDMNPKNARGFLALGTAQDAQSRHQEAEVSFREGIKYWQGDASPILNNLALNLASQGHLEESLALIKKAQQLAPNRIELERNKRIIATLLEANGPMPPAPNVKPAAGEETDSVAPKPQKKATAVQKTAPAPAPKKAEKIKEQVEGKAKEEEVTYTPETTQKISGTKFNVKLKPLSEQ